MIGNGLSSSSTCMADLSAVGTCLRCAPSTGRSYASGPRRAVRLLGKSLLGLSRCRAAAATHQPVESAVGPRNRACRFIQCSFRKPCLIAPGKGGSEYDSSPAPIIAAVHGTGPSRRESRADAPNPAIGLVSHARSGLPIPIVTGTGPRVLRGAERECRSGCPAPRTTQGAAPRSGCTDTPTPGRAPGLLRRPRNRRLPPRR